MNISVCISGLFSCGGLIVVPVTEAKMLVILMQKIIELLSKHQLAQVLLNILKEQITININKRQC